jgi:uncharacterized coiled-coil DUF342 family protein
VTSSAPATVAELEADQAKLQERRTELETAVKSLEQHLGRLGEKRDELLAKAARGDDVAGKLNDTRSAILQVRQELADQIDLRRVVDEEIQRAERDRSSAVYSANQRRSSELKDEATALCSEAKVKGLQLADEFVKVALLYEEACRLQGTSGFPLIRDDVRRCVHMLRGWCTPGSLSEL